MCSRRYISIQALWLDSHVMKKSLLYVFLTTKGNSLCAQYLHPHTHISACKINWKCGMTVASTVSITLIQASKSCRDWFSWCEQLTTCITSLRRLVETPGIPGSLLPALFNHNSRAGTQDAAFQQGPMVLLWGALMSENHWDWKALLSQSLSSGQCIILPLPQQALLHAATSTGALRIPLALVWSKLLVSYPPTFPTYPPPCNTCFLAHTTQFHWRETLTPNPSLQRVNDDFSFYFRAVIFLLWNCII